MQNPLWLLLKLVLILLFLLFGLLFVAIAIGAAHHYINRYGEEVVWSIVKGTPPNTSVPAAAGGRGTSRPASSNANDKGWRRTTARVIERLGSYNPSLVTIARRRRPILAVLGVLTVFFGWVFVRRTWKAVKEVSAEIESIRAADWSAVKLSLPDLPTVVNSWPLMDKEELPSPYSPASTVPVGPAADAPPSKPIAPAASSAAARVVVEAPQTASSSGALLHAAIQPALLWLEKTAVPALFSSVESCRQMLDRAWRGASAVAWPYIERLHNSSPEIRMLAAIAGVIAGYGLLRLIGALLSAVGSALFGDVRTRADENRRQRKRKPVVDRPHLRRANEPLDQDEVEEIVEEINRMVRVHTAVEEALQEARQLEEKERAQRQLELQREQEQQSQDEALKSRTPASGAGSGQGRRVSGSPAGMAGMATFPSSSPRSSATGPEDEEARRKAEAKAQARLALLLDIAESSGLPASNSLLQSIARPLLESSFAGAGTTSGSSDVYSQYDTTNTYY